MVALLIVVVAALAVPATSAARTVDVPRRASIVLAGEHRGDLAGASVARAGDVNGDGRGDVIVGASLADPRGRRDAGAAYVVFGGSRYGRVRLGELGTIGFPDRWRRPESAQLPSWSGPTGERSRCRCRGGGRCEWGRAGRRAGLGAHRQPVR